MAKESLESAGKATQFQKFLNQQSILIKPAIKQPHDIGSLILIHGLFSWR